MKWFSISLTMILLTCQFPFLAGQSLSPSANAALQASAVGEKIPGDALLIELEGDTTFYSALKGHWLLLDYWSATCIPCIKEMPFVTTLKERSAETGLKVVMINLDSKEKRWRRGIKLYNPPEPHFRTDRRLNNTFFSINLVQLQDQDKTVLSTMMPQYVLVAPDGTITDKKMPKPSHNEFMKRLDAHKKAYSQKLRDK